MALCTPVMDVEYVRTILSEATNNINGQHYTMWVELTFF